jgi:hypothetical protein
MKDLIIIVAILTLMSVVPTLAAEKLTERQLDSITAGTGGDGASYGGLPVQNSTDNASAQNQLDFGNPAAENVVNSPSVNINSSVDASQNIDSKNNTLVLKDYTQQNAKAVNIENSISSQVANAVNVHLNGLHPESLSSGSLNNLYQTNIIIQNHN